MPTSEFAEVDARRLGWLGEQSLLDLTGRQIEAVQDLQEAAMEGRWDDLRLASMVCLGLGETGLDYLESLVRVRRDRRAMEERARERLVAQYAATFAQSDVATVVAQLGENLEGPERSLLEEVLTAIAAGNTDPSVVAPLVQSSIVIDIRRQLLAVTNLTRVRGLMGLIQAEFQTNFESLQEDEPAVPVRRLAEGLELRSRAFEENLTAGQQRIRAALDAGSSQEVYDAIHALCAEVRREAPRLAAALAEGRRAGELILASGAGGAAEELGAELVRASFALRMSIASCASAGRLLVELEEPDSADYVEDVIAAGQEDFEYSIEDGLNTPIAHLENTEDERLVDVEGFVQEMRVTRLGGAMLISEIVLLDPSSETTTSAVGTFINAPNIGVTPGAYCRVTGRYKHASNLLEGRAGIEVERLDLADAREGSWLMAFLRLAAPWYHVWRNSLGLEWSLGPGAADESDSDNHFRGAGELVFLTPIRKEGLE